MLPSYCLTHVSGFWGFLSCLWPRCCFVFMVGIVSLNPVCGSSEELTLVIDCLWCSRFGPYFLLLPLWRASYRTARPNCGKDSHCFVNTMVTEAGECVSLKSPSLLQRRKPFRADISPRQRRTRTDREFSSPLYQAVTSTLTQKARRDTQFGLMVLSLLGWCFGWEVVGLIALSGFTGSTSSPGIISFTLCAHIWPVNPCGKFNNMFIRIITIYNEERLLVQV